MDSLTREQLATLLKECHISRRLVRELRFVPEEIEDWVVLDILAIGTRSKTEGILLIQTDNLYVVPYELIAGLKDNTTGRSKPVTCDFCYTWQQGAKAGRITFRRTVDGHLFTFLCCGDLRCSLHVRNMTPEAALSRTQLHEDVSVERRVTRLKEKMDGVMALLGARPTTLPAPE